MNQRELYFIVNSNAGHGKAGLTWQKIKAHPLFPSELSHTIKTENAAQGRDKTSHILRTVKNPVLIVAVGGDGTLHQVVNGFFEYGKIINSTGALGFLPIGTGCDFARNFGVPQTIEELLLALDKPIIKNIDVGHVKYTSLEGLPTERYFINMLNIGIGGLVAKEVQASMKKWGAFLFYFKDSIKGILKFKACNVIVKGQNQEVIYKESFQNIAIANGIFCGGGMKMAPRAKLSDGLFQGVFVRDRSKITTLYLFGTVYPGYHMRTSHIFAHQSSDFEILISPKEPPIYIEADGELLGRGSCKIKCLSQQIPFLVTSIFANDMSNKTKKSFFDLTKEKR